MAGNAEEEEVEPTTARGGPGPNEIGVSVHALCRHVYVNEHGCFMYVHMYILRLYVLYDYVQLCEYTVSVELPCIN